MKRGFDLWDILIIVGALVILFWASLKALGIISTPIWVDMVPYFGAGASIIGGAYKLGKIKRGIENTEEKINQLLEFEKRFGRIENEHNLAMEGKLNIRHK